MATTIDRLLVEISANSDLLRAEFKKAGVDVKGFGQETAKTAKDVGRLQERYARAALGVASATESIARQGRVTGESMKQVLTHGANMVAMFGIGGPIVGATAIALTAIVQLFHRTNEEAKRVEETIARLRAASQTRGQTDVSRAEASLVDVKTKTLEVEGKLAKARADAAAGSKVAITEQVRLEKELQQLKDVRAQGERELAAARVTAGDREIAQLAQLLGLGKATEAEKSRALQLEAQLRAELARTTGEDEQSKQRRIELQSQLNALTDHERRAAATANRQQERAGQTADALAAVRLELDALQASSAADPVAAINARFDKLATRLEQLERDAPEARDEIAKVRTELEATRQAQIALAREELFSRAQRAGVQAIGSALEVARQELKDTLAELKKSGVDPQIVAEAERLGEQFIAASEYAKQLDERLTALGDARLVPLKRMAALTKEREDAEAELARITGTSVRADEARAVIQGRIAVINREITGLQDAQAEHSQAAAFAAEGLRTSLSGALNIAFGLTSAMAGAEATLTRMIGATAQIAAGFEDVVQLAKEAGGLSKLFSSGGGVLSALPAIGQILGGAVAVGSLVSGIFGKRGETPEQRAQREATERLTRALDELRAELGDLGRLPISGSDLAAIRGLRFETKTIGPGQFGAPTEFAAGKSAKELLAELQALGVTMADLRKFAAEYNLTLSENPTVEELLAIQRVAKEVDGVIFPPTFQGRIAKMEAQMRAMGETDPLRLLIERFSILTGPQGAPALAKALDGLDLGSAEGRQAAIERLQELLANIGQLEDADFGGLLPSEFVDELLAMIEKLRAIDPSPLEAFANKLDLLRQRFEVEGTSAAQRVADLIDLFAGSFAELEFLKTGGAASTIDEVKARFKAVFDAAAADGVIDEKENAILQAFRELLGAMQQVADEALAQVRRDAEASDDNALRLLRAEGRHEEADALERQLARERELQALREAGVSEAIIQQRAYIQTLEEAARVAAQLAAAQQQAAEAERERAEFTEDIDIALRRAKGDTEGADAAELTRRQEERRKRAIDLKFSEEELKKLDELEKLERENLKKGDRSSGGEAAAASGGRQTGVQQITEKSAFEVVDVLRSQLLVAREQEVHLRDIRGLLAALGSRVAPVPVPSLTPGALAAAGAGQVQLTQTNYITLNIDGAGLSPSDLMQHVRAELVPNLGADARTMNRELGTQMRQELRGRGRLVP